MTYPLNEWGGPVLPDPPGPLSFKIKIIRFCFKYIAFAVSWPFLILGSLGSGRALAWTDLKHLYRLVSYAEQHPVDASASYQDRDLLRQLYQLESAQRYLQNSALEWQPREGYCAATTLRCILKSFGYPLQKLQNLPKAGANDPEHVCQAVDAINNTKSSEEKIQLDARIYRLDTDAHDVSYEKFLEELESNLKDNNTRVAVNYLRPALFGWPLPWYWWPIAPSGFFYGLFAGHFSPILGILRPASGTPTANKTTHKNEDVHQAEPLVAIFDVNHLYGGTYLVPARRLYEAVKAKDISTKLSRALVFVTDKSKNCNHKSWKNQ